MTTAVKSVLGAVAAMAVLFVALHYGAGRYLTPLTADAIPESAPVVSDSKLIGSRAPYFDLPDVTGNHHAISDYNNQPLLIVFFTTWNQAAADQMKILDDYRAAQRSDQTLAKIIAIDTQEERSVVSSFMTRGGYRIETLVDASGSTGEEYHIKSVPTTYFVDADGTVRGAYIGLMSQQMIEHNVEEILR